jgi:hypothetical protein
MINLYGTLPKKNSRYASCERVAGRPTAAILDAPRDGAFAGGPGEKKSNGSGFEKGKMGEVERHETSE